MVLPGHGDEGLDFRRVMELSKITIGGDLKVFMEEKGIGEIKGCRKVIDDGNTIVVHFWDEQSDYLLMQEIKY